MLGKYNLTVSDLLCSGEFENVALFQLHPYKDVLLSKHEAILSYGSFEVLEFYVYVDGLGCLSIQVKVNFL